MVFGVMIELPVVLLTSIPSISSERIELWDRVSAVVDQNADSCICVLGDFNSVRSETERDGRGLTINRRDIEAFDSFIYDANLIDLPLHGRKFTWYKADGKCKSRLDRMLVNNLWIKKWLNSRLKGLDRSILDHCPIL